MLRGALLGVLVCGLVAFSTESIRHAKLASSRPRGCVSSIDFLKDMAGASELFERYWTIRGATGDKGAADLAVIERLCTLQNVSDAGFLARLEQRFPDVYAKYAAENFNETTAVVEARAEAKGLSRPYRDSGPFGVMRRCLLAPPVRLLGAILTSGASGCKAVIQALEPDALQPDAAPSASESSNHGDRGAHEKRGDIHSELGLIGNGMAPGWEQKFVLASVCWRLEWELTRRVSQTESSEELIRAMVHKNREENGE